MYFMAEFCFTFYNYSVTIIVSDSNFFALASQAENRKLELSFYISCGCLALTCAKYYVFDVLLPSFRLTRWENLS